MGQRSPRDTGLQRSAKVEVAENWRSLAGKGRTLEALQNERYCSPCSLPGDRYDAWAAASCNSRSAPGHPKATDAVASRAGAESQKPG